MEKTITKIERTSLQPVKRKRVAAYARVSGGKDAQLHSLSAQVSYYNSYIGSRGDWALAGIYADEALTGTKSGRPEFQRMLTDCRAGKIDMVITKSVTRFARNTVTLLEAVRELKSLGIDVYFEKENIHALSADGELMLTLLASFAQEESRSVSENTKWAIRKRFEQGLPTPTNIYGYRYKDGTFHVVPKEAAVVKQIFSDYLSGLGVGAIIRKLHAQGIPSMHSAVWSPRSIGRMLRNEKYAGCLLLQKTLVPDHISKKDVPNRGELPQYFVENSHEAIVSREVFEQVQQRIKIRAEKYSQPSKPRAQHLFTGLLRCGLCGCLYRYKAARPSGRHKAAWICRTYFYTGRHACLSQQIPEQILIKTTAEVLGIAEFDREMLLSRIKEIQVPGRNRLIYIFHDGRIVETGWQRQPKKDIWTEEMRQKARERALKQAERRKKCQKM